MTKNYFQQNLVNFKFNKLHHYFLGVFTFLLYSNTLVAQEITPSYSEPFYLDREICKYYPELAPKLISVLRSPEIIERMNNRNPCSTINVDYNGFTTDAQVAFQFAVDIWASSLDSAIPITINANFTALPPNVLGSAGPNGFVTLIGVGIPDRFYPRALAESLLGQEIDGPNSIDINCSFSNVANFYFGLDANPPSGQVDFVSVVLHELAHGLGFIGFGFSDGTIGSIRDEVNGLPSIFDEFIVDGLGSSILNYPDPSTNLHAQLTSDALSCEAPTAVLENGGTRPKIFSPDPFNGGSSYSHWDETAFAGEGINSLMTPSIAPGEAVHNPGPITLGFFEDLGWSLCNTLSSEKFSFSNLAISPNPFNSRINIELPNVNSNSKFEISITDINGRIVFNNKSTGVNGRLEISNLDDLDAALYFITVQDLVNGDRITKKIIKN